MTDRFARYEKLRFARHTDGVLEIVMGEPGKLSTADRVLHRELAEVWRDVDADAETRVAILRGEGQGLLGGRRPRAGRGDRRTTSTVRARVWREARDLVYNVINCSKPIVSAMHGPAVGAGLVAGLLADISIAAKNARIIDGHTRLGVAAGDHAAIVWPLLCGMAKAKYYLLLCETALRRGGRAHRPRLAGGRRGRARAEGARGGAGKLAAGAQTAIRWTKYALNNWLRLAGPTFDASLALEMLGFTGPDAREGIASLREKRPARFDPSCPF